MAGGPVGGDFEVELVEIPESEVEFGDFFGRGSYGFVRKATWPRGSDSNVCVKVRRAARSCKPEFYRMSCLPRTVFRLFIT